MPTNLCPTCSGPVDAQDGVCPSCATQVHWPSPSPAAADAAPDGPLELPGYRIVRHLGQGGMGSVYLAEEELLGRNVAVKVVTGTIVGDPLAKTRFLREARTLATIEHPHVVRVYSFGEHEGKAFLVMEYVEGETLAERLLRNGRLSVDESLRITRQVVDALEAAWARRVIHRDIKPSNILLDARDQVRVVDFGLAKPLDVHVDSESTHSGGYLLGTPHYLSPEQAQGSQVDFRSDIYALGIMLFQMLSGERPFGGTSPVAIIAKHLHEPLPSLRAKRPEVPQAVEALLRWMTAKEPERRPESHAALREAIDRARLDDNTPTDVLPVRPPKPRSREWIVLAVILAAFVGLFFMPPPNLPQPAVKPRDPRLVVAVAPFYGPDAESVKEGRVMAALIERAVQQRIGRERARVIGIDAIRTPVRDHESARALGKTLGANAVIWGEAFALRRETEVEPHVTIVELGTLHASHHGERADSLRPDEDAPLLMAEQERGPLRLDAEAPNQIELRKTTASGVGEVVAFLAAIHALDTRGGEQRALALLRDVPRTAETLRYEAKALLQSGANDAARAKLEASLQLDPAHAQTLATLGDIELAAHRYAQAFALFDRAEKSGQPFSASRGFVQRGRLYVHETYVPANARNRGERSTLYLLEVEPPTGRIIGRWPLLDPPSRFRRNGEEMAIVFTPRTAGEATIVMRGNAFDRPLWLPVSYAVRVRSMKSAHVLPWNFLAGLEAQGGRGPFPAAFSRSARNDPGLPQTLPELAAKLRTAIEHDPTQPWHRFFLALTLREMKEHGEAQRAFDELLRTEYAGTPYYELAWMANYLERMRLTAWADALYPKVLATRQRLPQPAGTSLLVERLVNTPFPRAVVNRDMNRGWITLQHARSIGGLSVESDDVVAAAWSRYFRETGDERRAAQEESVMRAVAADPLNLVRTAVSLDQALVFAGASAATAVVLLLVLGTAAARRVRRSGARPAETPWIAALRERMQRLRARTPRLTLIVATTALLTAVLLGGVLLTVHGVIDGVWGFLLLLLAATVYILRVLRTPLLAWIAALRPAERRLLLAACGIATGASVIASMMFANLGGLLSMPIGWSDSIGHPVIVVSFEERLAHYPSHEGLRYLTAVANHYAGNDARARELYASLPPDQRVRGNREALDRHAMPAMPLTPREVGDGYLARPSWRELTAGLLGVQQVTVRPSTGILALALLLFFVLLLLLVRHDPAYAADPPPDRGWMRALMLLVPGLYDVRRGIAALGFVTLLGAAFIVVPAYMLLARRTAIGASPMSAGALPDIASTQPMPFTPEQRPMQWVGQSLRFTLPYTRPFWLAFVIAAVLVAAVHAWRIRTIVRQHMLRRCAPSPDSLSPSPPWPS